MESRATNEEAVHNNSFLKMEEATKGVLEHSSKTDALETTKFNLYSVYVLNLHVYLKLSELERLDHPVTDKLREIKSLLEKANKKTVSRDKTQENMNRVKEEETSSRTMTRDMIKNRVRNKKAEPNNPRVKNREKARKLSERGKWAFDGNIDVNRCRSAKY